jgi:uncharacterized membrane protein
MTEQPETTSGGGALRSIAQELPTDQLKEELQSFMGALAQRAVSIAASKVGDATESLTKYADGGGPAAKAAGTGVRSLAQGKPLRGLMRAGVSGLTGLVTKSLGGGGSGGDSGGKKLKVTNIVEQIDVGVPRRATYDMWTQFQEFPTFMKKVETVNQEEDEKLTWKAQVLWSHRTWRSTIVEQVPERRIVWQSEGDKGYVDGAVTFHELAPELTRILLVLEYHPAGFFEGTGNLWRAQGRRVRLELKHFRRQVMTQTILHPDEVEGWRGEIRDGQVVSTDGDQGGEDGRDRPGGEHRAAKADEQAEPGDRDEAGDDGYEDEDTAEGERSEDEDYDEADEDEGDADESYDQEAYANDEDLEEDENDDEDEYEDEPEEARGSDSGEQRRQRQRVKAGSR